MANEHEKEGEVIPSFQGFGWLTLLLIIACIIASFYPLNEVPRLESFSTDKFSISIMLVFIIFVAIVFRYRLKGEKKKDDG